MLSRVYAKSKDDKKIVIEYYDYDNINEDGSSFLHIVEFDMDKTLVFGNVIRFVDYSYQIRDTFLVENGWDVLIDYLKGYSINYKYDKRKLTKEQRLKYQKDQFTIPRWMRVGSIAEVFVNDYKKLNEFERIKVLDEIKERIRRFEENCEVEYEYSVDYEDDECRYMVSKSEIDSIDYSYLESNVDGFPHGVSFDVNALDLPRYINSANKCPKIIRPLLKTWRNKAKKIEIETDCKIQNAVITFIYNNKLYELDSCSIDVSDNEFSRISYIIENDLKRAGCLEVINWCKYSH